MGSVAAPSSPLRQVERETLKHGIPQRLIDVIDHLLQPVQGLEDPFDVVQAGGLHEPFLEVGV